MQIQIAQKIRVEGKIIFIVAHPKRCAEDESLQKISTK